MRLEVALRERDVIAGERDALAAELEALRSSAGAAQAEERARQQEFYDAAEQRIRELELQLTAAADRRGGRRAGPGCPTEAKRSAKAEPAPAAVYDAPRRASRHAFIQDLQIQIDGSATQLVDLSTTGAQVISPTALKPNRMVKVALPMGDGAVSCRGKIVWARLEPPSAGRSLCYRAGVLFTDRGRGAHRGVPHAPRLRRSADPAGYFAGSAFSSSRMPPSDAMMPLASYGRNTSFCAFVAIELSDSR